MARPIIGLVVAVLFAIGSAQAAPKVQKVRSAGAVEAWLVEDHTNPIIHLSLSFKGGAALDPDGKEGLARMVAGLLDEGSGDLDSQAYQKALEDHSIRLSFGARLDRFSAGLRTLKRHQNKAFDLLRSALNAPRFDPEPVARMRAQILAAIARSEKDPDDIADRIFLKTLYPTHPYGRPSAGTRDGVAAVTREDLLQFVSDRLVRDTLVIGVYGDITAEELAPLLDSTFADLPPRGARQSLAKIEPQTDGGVTTVQANVPQSVIMFGQTGIDRRDPDFYTALVLNKILGVGSVSSRLYTEVREKRGLAYAIGTSLWPLDRSALWVGQAGTLNKNVGETVALVRAQWRRLRDDGPSKAEVEDGKTYLTGSFALRFTSGASIARTLVAMQVWSLGQDYLDSRNRRIEAVSQAQLRDLARRLLDPDRLTFVVVGEPQGLDASSQ